MAGLGGGGLLAGIADGLETRRERKDKQYEEGLNRAYQKQRDDEQKREFDVTSAEAERRDTNTYEVNTLRAQAAQAKLDAALTGKDPKTQAYIRNMAAKDRLDEALTNVAQGKVPIEAATVGKINAETGLTNARTEYTRNGLTPLAAARVKGINANIDLTRERIHDLAVTKPQEFKARLAEQYAALAQRPELARMNNDAKQGIARLAAAARLQGVDSENATKLAVAQYNGENADWRSVEGADNADARAGVAPQPIPGAMPTINLNLGQGGANGNPALQKQMQDAFLAAQPPAARAGVVPPKVGAARPPAVKGRAPAPPPVGADKNVTDFMAGVNARHLTPEQIGQLLERNVASKALTPEEAQMIRSGLSGRLPGAAPRPPIPGGQAGGGNVPFLNSLTP